MVITSLPCPSMHQKDFGQDIRCLCRRPKPHAYQRSIGDLRCHWRNADLLRIENLVLALRVWGLAGVLETDDEQPGSWKVSRCRQPV